MDLTLLVDNTTFTDRYLTAEPGLSKRTIEGLAVKHPKLVAHPEVFSSVSVDGLAEIGSLVTKEKAARHMALTLTKTPVNLSSRLVFFR
ncbi:MAG: hypothetical protein PHG14_00445 [Desulfobacter postgatei]|uniref:Uncharacterized protein n=1 Tax=Desulfobacter postgatei 2ac9 TaxID=879212 RepID=I5B7J4_9BACT|nr:hypothetical protein [Desulfobacter postgatei]EIM65457.1 hypothetical protein DespoDRAFT_03718 [Desulfobacter postgatei 2ac9]MDD4272177.1 hypothetical protein [Desulfobacter postgatei]